MRHTDVSYLGPDKRGTVTMRGLYTYRAVYAELKDDPATVRDVSNDTASRCSGKHNHRLVKKLRPPRSNLAIHLKKQT